MARPAPLTAPPLDPYAGLVVAVLRLAIDDSRSNDARGAEARAFVASEAFTMWAELLGLDGEDVTARLRALR